MKQLVDNDWPTNSQAYWRLVDNSEISIFIGCYLSSAFDVGSARPRYDPREGSGCRDCAPLLLIQHLLVNFMLIGAIKVSY